MHKKCIVDTEADGSLRSLKIPMFDPDTLPPTAASLKGQEKCLGGVKILVIGAPGRGKSHYIKWLMMCLAKKTPAYLVMSGTESETGFYGKFVPRAFIHTEYSDEALNQLLRRQKTMSTVKGRAPWVTVVVDDCATELKKLKEGALKTQNTILKNGRHLKINYIVGVQDVMDIKAEMRTSFDYVVVLGKPNEQRKKAMMDMYCSMFNTIADFSAVLNEVTEVKYRALVVRTSSPIETGVFWSMAPKTLHDIKLGSVEYRCIGNALLDEDKYSEYRGIAKNSAMHDLVSEDEGF